MLIAFLGSTVSIVVVCDRLSGGPAGAIDASVAWAA
jgi:hypothetical protein